MTGCAGVLAERISKNGPISFRDFMETALYDPEEGYYSVRAAIGEGGDFTTAPSISPLFARAVARAFAGDAGSFEGPIDFVEVAAGEGVFLRDFRRELAALDPAVARRTRIRAVERSARGRESIVRSGVAERVFADASQLAENSISGWIFSNELYDALPVHRVRMREGKVFELGVALNPERRSTTAGADAPAQAGLRDPEGKRTAAEGRGAFAEPVLGSSRSGSSEASGALFTWVSFPAGLELSDYLARFGVELAEGQIAEINLDAGPLHRTLCRAIRRGRIVSFDYGHRASILYHSHARPSGTLAVHSKGRRGGDPLENPGLVDLTAHVNWDDLLAAGEAEGFESQEVRRLSRFLVESGLFQDAYRDKIAAMRLLDPEGLGETLSVLVQSKAVASLHFFSQLTSGR